MKDKRDYFDLSDIEVHALENIEDKLDSSYRMDQVWQVIKENEGLYNMWKQEKEKIEFKKGKQQLKDHDIDYLLNTPYFKLDWYEKIVIAPIVLSLKTVNWFFQEMVELVEK